MLDSAFFIRGLVQYCDPLRLKLGEPGVDRVNGIDGILAARRLGPQHFTRRNLTRTRLRFGGMVYREGAAIDAAWRTAGEFVINHRTGPGIAGPGIADVGTY